jgi:hypothetical protein
MTQRAEAVAMLTKVTDSSLSEGPKITTLRSSLSTMKFKKKAKRPKTSFKILKTIFRRAKQITLEI